MKVYYWVHNDHGGSLITTTKDKNAYPMIKNIYRFDWSGPFETLAKAKKEAIKYHQIDLTTARMNISEIRSLKKSNIT